MLEGWDVVIVCSLLCAVDCSDWILFVSQAYILCAHGFINQAYLVGQQSAIAKWLRKGCEENQDGSILTIMVRLRYAMRPK